MVITSAWSTDGLRSDLWGDGPIAVFRAEGECCPDRAGPMLSHAQQCVGDWRSAALVADYSRARMAITAETLCSSVTKVISGHGALSLPTALVVRTEHLRLWRGYTRMLADFGILRGLFVDYDEALRWVSTQAAIFTLEAAHRQRQTPTSG